MTSRELRRLGRRDLLELLVRQEQQNEELRARVSELEELLSERSIAIENCGTMAEAAMVLNSVFESADRAAAQYLESIKQQEKVCEKIVSEAEARAKAIVEDAEKEKQRKKREAEEYARKLSARIEAYFKAHPGLYEQMKADEKK